MKKVDGDLHKGFSVRLSLNRRDFIYERHEYLHKMAKLFLAQKTAHSAFPWPAPSMLVFHPWRFWCPVLRASCSIPADLASLSRRGRGWIDLVLDLLLFLLLDEQSVSS